MRNRHTFLAAAFGAFALAGGSRAAEPVATPAGQRDQQKRANAAVEQTARQVSTTLRILAYQKLDPTAEQRVLDEVAGSLRRLSQEEMKAILAHLETAVKAPDEATATAEQREAYQKHRAVVSSLRGILFRLDILRSLDEAAKRYADASKAQFGLHQRALRADAIPDAARVRNATRLLSEEREQQADAQTDLRNELANLVKQLALLKPKLDAEQKARIDKADAFGRSGQLLGQMESALQSVNGKNFRGASEGQLKISRELQALAAALATPRDALAVLKDTRERVEQARKAEEALRAETQALKDKEKEKAGQPARPNRFAQDPQPAEAARLADRQGLIEFETREARKALEEVSKELAAKLTPAESEMRRGQEDLRDKKLDDARQAEANAAEKLQEARDELDKRIAASERQKSDPLVATKKAAEMLDKLIQEQKANQELTKKSEGKPEGLRAAAEAQKEIALKVDEVKEMPHAENADAKKALDAAADATKEAAIDLANKDAKHAQPKQADAVKALEEAKKALDAQAAAIEKRRDDIAKLEEAKSKLAELAREEKKVADGADAEARKPAADADKANDLAQKQGELTPPTKAVGEMVKEAAPEAAKKVGEAAESQEMAKGDLAKNDAKKGAADANDAAKKLDEAADAVGKKIDELKAKEIADQAALQPNKVDPADAGKQIAKAIEQARDASEAAKRAADAADPGAATPAAQQSAEATASAQAALSQAQANAPKAVKPQLDEAAKQLAQASKELGKGEPAEAGQSQDKAVAELTQALSALNAAAQAAGQPTAEPGQGQQAQANTPGEQPGKGEKPGQEPGQDGKPGDKPGKGAKDGKDGKDGKPGDGPEKNDGQSEGDRTASEKLKAATARLNADNKSGNFINLQKMERDKVQQNGDAAFPAEFRELIRQYNMNIKNKLSVAPPKK